MSQFGTILKFELRKAFRQRLFLITLGIMIAILCANELTPVVLGNFRENREREARINGTVIDQSFLDHLAAADDPHVFGNLYDFILYGTGKNDVSGLTEEGVYQSRIEIIKRRLREDGVSERGQAYWLTIDEQNEKPYVYTSYEAYYAFFDIVGYFNFMILILCAVGLSGLFAEEKHTGADQLIFASRYGKGVLFLTKLITALALGLVSSAILLLTQFILCMLLYGFAGGGTLLQVFYPLTTLPLTVGGFVKVLAWETLFLGLVLAVFTATVSLLTMNHAATTGVMIAVMFLTMFNIKGGPVWFQTIWDAKPFAFVGTWLLDNYNVVALGGRVFNVFEYAPVFWLLFSVALVALQRVRYQKYEVM